ncbi:hypothetical protein LJC26_06900 [Desulfovibrio sp. OttesenSCG-928-O18]|nr:hypothetical protein [Desulfovibrio sp. OttesenSCG-928-O18]
MHECLRLYETSLGILRQEEEAIEREDEERLLELCAKRAALMEEAWEKRAGCDPLLVLEKLEAIQREQARLSSKATAQQETLRLALQSSRRENTRLAGYGKVVGHRQNALIVSKEG